MLGRHHGNGETNIEPSGPRTGSTHEVWRLAKSADELRLAIVPCLPWEPRSARELHVFGQRGESAQPCKDRSVETQFIPFVAIPDFDGAHRTRRTVNRQNKACPLPLTGNDRYAHHSTLALVVAVGLSHCMSVENHRCISASRCLDHFVCMAFMHVEKGGAGLKTVPVVAPDFSCLDDWLESRSSHQLFTRVSNWTTQRSVGLLQRQQEYQRGVSINAWSISLSALSLACSCSSRNETRFPRRS